MDGREFFHDLIVKLLDDKKEYGLDDWKNFFDPYLLYYRHIEIILIPYADADNIKAIEALLYLHTKHMFYEVNSKQLVKYYAKVCDDPHIQTVFGKPYDKLLECYEKEVPYYLAAVISDMKKTMNNIAKQINILAEDVKSLRLEVRYMPHGSGFKEAEDEFKRTANK